MRYMEDNQQQSSYPSYHYSPFYPSHDQFLAEGGGSGSGGQFHQRPPSCPGQQMALQPPHHPSHNYPGPHFDIGSMKPEPEDYEPSSYPTLYASNGYGYTEADRFKLERKRERNRIAATKCRCLVSGVWCLVSGVWCQSHVPG